MMRWLTGALAATALLVAGCGGTTSQIGAGASDLVPATAPVFIAVDSNPHSQQWQTVDRLASKFPDKAKAITSLEDELRQDPGVDWNNDVKPALGDEIDFVWLDFEQDGDNFVILTQPKDESAFKKFIEKANAAEDKPSDRVHYEKFHGWYVLGEQAPIDRFEQASDAATRSLSDESAFKQSMDRLGGDSIVRGYVNGGAVMDVIRKYGGTDVEQYIDKAGTLDWIAFRAGAKSDGVGFDAIVHGRPGELFKDAGSAKGFEPELPGHVPQNALLYLTFHGTKGMFARLQKNKLFNSPDMRRYKDVFDDLDTLLQGENAFYMRPGSARFPGVPFKLPEITFVASPGKDEDGALIVDRLLDRQLRFVPSRTTIDGTTVRRIDETGLPLYYGNVDGRLVFTDVPAGIRGFKHPGTSLADSEKYRSMKKASGLPDETPVLVYVDIHSTIPFAEKLAQTRIPEEIRRNLKPLDAAVEYAATRTAEARISFFLVIK